MADGRFISYLRVSTRRQGESGLGLEAQRKSVSDFLNGGNWHLLCEYVEVESGKKNDRPQLTKALLHCKTARATLVIAKLDRLSRDAHFLIGLQKAGVKFKAVDLPEMDEMVVGIMALMAERERKLISERTRKALQAAKDRGIKLGCPKGAAHLRQYGNEAAVTAIKSQADEHAQNLAPIIADIQASGWTTLRAIAYELNKREIQTPRSGRWHPTGVARVLARTRVQTKHVFQPRTQ